MRSMQTSRTSLRSGLAALAALVLLASAGLAQEEESDLREELEALRRGQENIERQLQELKRLIQAQGARARAPAPPPRANDVAGQELDLGSNPVKGEATAPLTLVEFTDYQ